MITMSAGQLAETLGATADLADHARPVGPDVCIDSRLATPGAVFFALPGEQADGHDFALAALTAGAAVVVAARPVAGAAGQLLIVPDVVAALGRLGRLVTRQARGRGMQVVAITGSAGKTTTKDLLAQILEQSGPTVAPQGSFNNELGVPLTASRVDQATRYLVSEMGARGKGHIAYLCQITPPDVSVVLNVGHAHLGEFGSQQAIAEAKAEIVVALEPSGTAILNADDPYVLAMAEQTSARVLLFSGRGPVAGDGAAVWASNVSSNDRGEHQFTLSARTAAEDSDISARPAQVVLHSVGRQHVDNAAAAAAAALALGTDWQVIADALCHSVNRSRWRMELSERGDGVLVVNDAYNANPESMLAACRTLAELGTRRNQAHTDPVQTGAGPTRAIRTWAVLGDMLELGPASAAEHHRLGRAVAELGIDRLLALGDRAAVLVDGAREAGMADRAAALPGKDAVAGWLASRLRPGDVVLVKASRGMGLETVAAALLRSGDRQ